MRSRRRGRRIGGRFDGARRSRNLPCMSAKAAVLLSAALVACSATGSKDVAQATLATDLPAPFIDTALRTIARAGGPEAERSATSSAAVDVFWDAEPYAAIQAANRGELSPMPQT